MVPQKKKKKPTPSTQRRNARRREEFLKKKVNASTEKKLSSPGEPVSGKEAEAPPKVLHHHPSPSPSAERRQVITVGRERARSTFSQLDGDLPSSPDTASGLQPSSPPPSSAPVQPSADYAELLAFVKAQAEASRPIPYVPLFAKDQAVFSSSCDKSEAS